jgi:chemotaxis signal transduction protein
MKCKRCRLECEGVMAIRQRTWECVDAASRLELSALGFSGTVVVIVTRN